LKKIKAFIIRVIKSEGEVSGRNITDINMLPATLKMTITD
jgi:hypothetical protein